MPDRPRAGRSLSAHRRTVRTALLSVVAAAALMTTVLPVPIASAATVWYVDAANGNSDTDCGTGDGAEACSTMAAAIAQAGGGDIVKVAAGEYNESLVIDTGLSLVGAGPGNVTLIDADQNQSQPAPGISVTATAAVSISGMTITASQWGSAAVAAERSTIVTLSRVALIEHPELNSTSPTGGGVSTEGRLTIANSTVTGGAIGVAGAVGSTVVIDNVTVRNSGFANVVMGGFSSGGYPDGATASLRITASDLLGGGLFGLIGGVGTLTAADTTVTESLVGVGLLNTARGTLTRVTVKDNSVVGIAVDAGANGEVPGLAIKDSTITGNGGEGYGNFQELTGGLVSESEADITISGTTIADNTAGVHLTGGSLEMTDSVVRHNLPVEGGSSAQTNGGMGVALMTTASGTTPAPQLSITRSEISGNLFGVGAYNAGMLIVSSTVNGNSDGGALISRSPAPVALGNVRPAAIGDPQPAGTMVILNSTITDNGDVPGVNEPPFGSIGVDAGTTAVVAGSIVTGAEGGDACSGVTHRGTIVDGGYNVADDETCGFTETTSTNGADPQLSALDNNGGPTRTRLIAYSSPAVNAIPLDTTITTPGPAAQQWSLCATGTVDQRGESRPNGTACDIGAVEIVSPPAITTETLPDGTEDKSYSTTLRATGGAGAPYSWAIIDGALPRGLTLTDGGTIEGTPTAEGDFAFTVQVDGQTTKRFTLTIAAAPVTPTTPVPPTTPAPPTTPNPTPSSTPTPSAAPTTPTPSASASTTAPVGGDLADTGADGNTTGIVLIGVLALLAGLAALAAGAAPRLAGRHRH